MPLSEFQKKLENDLKKSVKLTINDNRSTMLSVKWEPGCTKVSLHRFFVNAPDNIMKSLACYIKQEEKTISNSVRSFIEDSMRKLDYSHLLNKMKLDVNGITYNLKTFLDEINKDYFDNLINLNITWFGRRNQKNRSQVTFGLYYEPLKLIKIHRLLDKPEVPDYMISYVIYHEMLHFVCPSYFDKNGKHRIHNKEFREKELQFKDYQIAQDWINNNRERLFSH
jgi:hypothetical protein